MRDVIIFGVGDLFCSHKEADTRVFACIARYATENTSNPLIAVRASVTDILNLLLLFSPRLDAQMWMEANQFAQNRRDLWHFTLSNDLILSPQMAFGSDISPLLTLQQPFPILPCI